jgi:RNA recognition motif. (a.k.a. RRM, RBD, or RNP domain)
MSYPPPPGLKSSQPATSAPPHPSLPARPPPSTVPPAPIKAAFPAASYPPSSGAHAGRGVSYAPPAYQGFQPRQLGPSTIAAAPAGYSSYQQPQYPPQQYYEAPEQNYGAPQIRNPFPLPGQNAAPGGYNAVDPEMEAQIAQWQSAYSGKDSQDSSKSLRRFGNTAEGSLSATSANAAPLGGRSEISSHAVTSAADADTAVATVVRGADGKQATVVRTGGGTQWTDSSLLEWDPSHFRIFVGNLAGEVTDESLLKAFSRWPSVQKARVIRDKRTTKSKGFGFVSFSDGDEFFQAAREMQGKYIGSHPVSIKRSTTEIKAVVPKDNKKHKGKHGKGGGSGGNAKTDAGVHKAGSKTKGGLRVLG